MTAARYSTSIGLAAVCVLTLAARPSAVRDDPRVTLLPSGRTDLLVATTFLDAVTGFAVGGLRETGTPAVLLRTADGAHTWTSIDTGLETRLYDIHFPTSQIGYAVGLHGIVLKTEDRGRTWRQMPSQGEIWMASVFFTSPTVGFAAGGNRDEMLLMKTEDGGRSWRSLVGGIPDADRPRSLRDVRFFDAQRGIATGDEGGILTTADGGQTWLPRQSGTKNWLRAATYGDASHLYVGGTLALVRSVDAGAIWTLLSAPSNEKINDLVFVSPSIGYATTMDGRLWWTEDSGDHWRRLHDNRGQALTGMSFVNASLGFAVGDSGTVLEIRTGAPR